MTSMSVSACSCCMLVSFCMTCSLFMLVEDETGTIWKRNTVRAGGAIWLNPFCYCVI